MGMNSAVVAPLQHFCLSACPGRAQGHLEGSLQRPRAQGTVAQALCALFATQVCTLHPDERGGAGSSRGRVTLGALA